MADNTGEVMHADVLVLGAGFAGKAVVDALFERLSSHRGTSGTRVVLIDRKNYQLFTPMLYQAATGLVDPAHIAEPIRKDAKKRGFTFIKSVVRSVNLAHKVVVTNIGNLSYERLVIALGSVPDDGRIEGAKGNCIPLKSLSDSEAIHNRVLDSFEKAARTPKGDITRKRLLTFVVIGGSTGSELAGSLRDYLDLLCDYYPTISENECKVIVVERGHRLFPGEDERLSKVVARALEKRRVELRLNTKVTRVNASSIELEDGTVVETENTFWNAGTKPNPLVEGLPESLVPKHRGRVIVDEYLRIPIFGDVYVIGDDAAVRQGGATQKPQGRFVAPTAEAALEEGKYVGKRIANQIAEGRNDGDPFRFKEKGTMLSLGHRYGVVKLKHVTLEGLWGWIVWRAVHVALLSSGSGRFNVIVDWTLGSFGERSVFETDEGEEEQARASKHLEAGAIAQNLTTASGGSTRKSK